MSQQKVKIPIFCIDIPAYRVDHEPAHALISKPVDQLLSTHFAGQEFAIRCLSSSEHSDKSLEELVEIIKALGTDRYDLNRKGDRYENVEKKRIDFFALKIRIEKDGEIFSQFTYPFFHFGKLSSSKPEPVRIDVMLLYNLDKLEQVFHHYKGRSEEKSDGFCFKDPNTKQEALKAIIKIT